MNAVDRYSEKAVTYAQCRWDYAAEAIQTLVTECGLSENWIIADIGSGTGMVTRHFVDRVRTVFAVEPNSDMRNIATEALRAHGSYRGVNGFSDATTLPENSVRMITVGRALHWFPAESTRAEFCRILKPDGWLAIFSVRCTDPALLDSMKAVRIEENGWNVAVDKERMNLVPLSFYLGHDSFRTLIVAGSVRESWEDFLGRMCSISAAPGPDHPLRPNLERALRQVFEQHAVDGILNVSNATEVRFGQVPRSRGPLPLLATSRVL